MATRQEILEFYRQPAEMTSPGGHARLFDDLPRDVAGLAGVVQGLYLHEHMAGMYGTSVSNERRSEVHIRSTEKRLGCLLSTDSRSLAVARPVDGRLIADCRHITVLLVGMLRAQGVPARSRCGFGTYFARSMFVDHWVCEYWNSDESRWTLVDAQLDAVQRAQLKPDFDVLDVPRDRFLVAGDAWALCRSGAADAAKFGILDMKGLWFIAGNVVRDAAALNNMEMLPWDVWGGMLQPGESANEGQLAFLNRLAELTRDPDAGFDELRTLYESDERVRVPRTVFNAILNRPETI